MNLPFQTAPESICILRLSAIGDVTHILPTLRSIQHQWPETRITWVIGKLEATLVDDIEGVEFILFDKSSGWRAYQQLKQQLQGREFDILLHMQVSLRASLASLFIKAPVKLGFDRDRARNLQWLFSTHKIQSRNPRQHVLDGFLEFAHTIGIKQDVIRWDIPLPEGSAGLFAILGKERKYFVINPCSSSTLRNWSAENYASLIDYVHEHHDLNCVLTGGPADHEKEFATLIQKHCQNKLVNLVGQTTLKQLLAVLAHAEIVIAPDTGPVHMANASQTPVIGLYASSNPMRTGPYSWLDYVVNTYPSMLQQETGKTVEQCRWGKRVKKCDAMMSIQLDDVIDQFERCLKLPRDKT